MKSLTLWLLTKLLFAGTMFFAAGAPPIIGGNEGADAGEGAGGDVDNDAGGNEGQDHFEDGEEAEEPAALVKKETPQETEEPEISEFKGLASARLRKFTEQAPELKVAFQKHPEVQAKFEAVLRRDAAFRDVFPTVAEARQFREAFPAGMADVQQIQTELADTEALDKDFYTRDKDGNYPGHPQLLSNMFKDDQQATVALLKNSAKEWSRLDPDSYNESMGQIFGATLAHYDIPGFVSGLIASAKEAKQDGIASELGKLLNWAQSYSREKPRPTPEQEKLSRERETFNRERQTRDQEDGQRFQQSFVGESRKLQASIISNHPAIKRLEKVSSISAEKRGRIVEDVRKRMEIFLGKSKSFMSKLQPAHQSRNLKDSIEIQKAAWNQTWLLNRMVREVMKSEAPNFQTRPQPKRNTGAPAAKPAAKPGEEPKRTQPYKEGKNWYYADGRRMSTEDVLRLPD